MKTKIIQYRILLTILILQILSMSTIIIKFETFNDNKIEYENLEIYELLTNEEKNIIRLIHINAEDRKELKELGFK